MPQLHHAVHACACCGDSVEGDMAVERCRLPHHDQALLQQPIYEEGPFLALPASPVWWRLTGIRWALKRRTQCGCWHACCECSQHARTPNRIEIGQALLEGTCLHCHHTSRMLLRQLHRWLVKSLGIVPVSMTARSVWYNNQPYLKGCCVLKCDGVGHWASGHVMGQVKSIIGGRARFDHNQWLATHRIHCVFTCVGVMCSCRVRRKPRCAATQATSEEASSNDCSQLLRCKLKAQHCHCPQCACC
jgi:hypothetical protein